MDAKGPSKGTESDAFSYFSSDEDIRGSIGSADHEDGYDSKIDSKILIQSQTEKEDEIMVSVPNKEEKAEQQKLLEMKALAELSNEAKRGALRASKNGPSAWSGCPLPKTNKTFLVNTLVSTLRHPIKKKDKRKDWKSYSDDGTSKSKTVHKKYHNSDEHFNPNYEHYLDYYNEQMNFFMYANNHPPGPFYYNRGFHPGRRFKRGPRFDRGRPFDRGHWFDRGYPRGRGKDHIPHGYTQTGDYDEMFKFDSEFDAYAYREDGKNEKPTAKGDGDNNTEISNVDPSRDDKEVNEADGNNRELNVSDSYDMSKSNSSPVNETTVIDEPGPGGTAETSDKAGDDQNNEITDMEKNNKPRTKKPDGSKRLTPKHKENSNQNDQHYNGNNQPHHVDSNFQRQDGYFDHNFHSSSARFFNRGWRPRYRSFHRPPFYLRGPRPYWHPNMYLKNFQDVPRQSVRCEGGILYRNGLYFVPRDSDSEQSNESDDDIPNRKKRRDKHKGSSGENDVFDDVDVMKYGDFESYYKAVMSAKNKRLRKHKHKKTKKRHHKTIESEGDCSDDELTRGHKRQKHDKTKLRHDSSSEKNSDKSSSECSEKEREGSGSDCEVHSESSEQRSDSHSSNRRSKSKSARRRSRERKHKSRRRSRSNTETNESYSDHSHRETSLSSRTDDSEYSSHSESESHGQHRSSHQRKRQHHSSDSHSDSDTSDSKHKHKHRRRKKHKRHSYQSKHKSKH